MDIDDGGWVYNLQADKGRLDAIKSGLGRLLRENREEHTPKKLGRA